MKIPIGKRMLLLWVILFLILPGTVRADGAPKPDASFYVNDYAGVVDPKTENRLINEGIRLHKRNGAQVVLVTVNNTGGVSMKDYANYLFNEWGVGSAEKNNGLLLLMSIQDDDYWAVQGSGIQDTVTDERLSAILRRDLEPDFAAKKYSAGAVKAYQSFVRALGGDSGALPAAANNVVSDNSGVLSRVTKDYLNQSAASYGGTTGTKVYVVTVNNKGNGTLQDYAYMKFNSVGASARDVMLVLDIAGDDYHILQGSQVDGILTNEVLGKMLRSVLEPYFDRKDYAGGAARTADAIYRYMLERSDIQEGDPVPDTVKNMPASATVDSSKDILPVLFGLTIFAVLVLLPIATIIVLVARRIRPRGGDYYSSYDRGGSGGGYRPWGWGHRYRRPRYQEPRRSGGFWGSSGWGSSGGGGGGSSSGGGAGRSAYEEEERTTNHGGGGSSSGGGAGRYSSGGSSWGDSGSSGGSSWSDSGSSGGSSWGSGSSSSGGSSDDSSGGNASSGGGVGRHS